MSLRGEPTVTELAEVQNAAKLERKFIQDEAKAEAAFLDEKSAYERVAQKLAKAQTRADAMRERLDQAGERLRTAQARRAAGPNPAE